ncbi:MAG: peptidoglycan-binding protein [Oscillospiraceae bacterium]|nr:peptidoglycan-binding protein [Oscillospiraceae bacterium]
MKNIKAFVCLLLVLCTSVTICGCQDENQDYPVTIGNITFEESPKSIAVLSPNLADIIDCIGYDVKVALVSEEIITENLKSKPTCGTAIDPDTKLIADSGVSVVIADDNLSDGAVKELENNGIQVVQFHYGNQENEVITTYKSIGAILGGAEGRTKGENAYKTLVEQMSVYKEAVNEDNRNCRLLYLSGTGPYVTAVSGSWYNRVLNYTGVTVVTDSVETPTVTLTEIMQFKAEYLIYDGNTFKDLQTKDSLKDSVFFKEGHTREISKDRLKLQGTTVLKNLKDIISLYDKIAIEVAEKNLSIGTSNDTGSTIAVTVNAETENNSEKAATTNSTSEVTSTEVNSSKTSTASSTAETSTVAKNNKKPDYELQSKYGVKFTSSAIETMVKQGENKYIKAMQERLSALGYIEKDNITGYFGDVTESSIKDFEEKNKLSVDGKVTAKMLKKLFSSNAKKK